MLHKLRFIATLACLSLSFSVFAEEINFINDDLRAGINRAAGEGKLVFLEFWASYCTPCKMMEEYTFTNTSVIERMTNNYVPVKVNIQSFDGFDLKNQYKITVLPTIIILDSKGRQLGRYEETMSPSKLNSVLDKYNVPQNRSRPATFANYTGVNSQANKVNPAPPSVSAPAAVRSPLTAYNNVPQAKPTASTSASGTARLSPTAYNTTNTPQVKPAVSPSVPAASTETRKRLEIPTNGFTIQAGAYGQIASAQAAIEEMKPKLGSQKQYIMQSKTPSGKITYRILIGNFTSRQQADVFRKKAALEGFIRSFDEFGKK